MKKYVIQTPNLETVKMVIDRLWELGFTWSTKSTPKYEPNTSLDTIADIKSITVTQFHEMTISDDVDSPGKGGAFITLAGLYTKEFINYLKK
jgi:hypothetical protein